MGMGNSGSNAEPPPLRGRRDLLALALAGAGAGVLGCSGGGGTDTGGLLGGSGPGFVDPTTAAEYLATMHLGTQAGDYLEMPYEPAGLPNEVFAADFDNMRNQGRFDHVRIPANCAARADVNGLITEDFLLKIDAQLEMALARFERVILDPLHHYLQWKGEHVYDYAFDDHVAVAWLTADQHAVRATAMWRQLATRYKDVSSRLSFDLFNEPTQVAQQGDYPPGLTLDQLNAWHAFVIPEIRKTGGNNAQRMIWIEPYTNRLYNLLVPANVGPVGVSPHYYDPFGFTHGSGPLTAGGMANYVEDIKYAKEWAAENKVPLWVGESGVSVNIDASQVPRPAADRSEFTAHIRNTCLAYAIPVCYWGYNSAFAQYDQVAGEWMPDMVQAVSGIPGPLPVRPVPPFMVLKGGRIMKYPDPGSVWPGFVYTPETGVLTAEANDSGADRSIVLTFPDIAVGSMQSWIVRAVAFVGNWRIGTAPYFYDPAQRDNTGRLGIDLRARDNNNRGIYPRYSPVAPGGFENPYGPIASPGTFLGIELIFSAGSPAGNMTFECIRTV